MTRQLLTAIGIGVLCGLGADAAWGPRVGVGVAVYVTVMGVVVVILKRNQRDLGELEDELEIRRSGSVRRRGPPGP